MLELLFRPRYTGARGVGYGGHGVRRAGFGIAAAVACFGQFLAFSARAARVNQSKARQRRVVHYQGRVQGVGFRYTVQRIAAGHAVTGFVENLPDGRVRIVCEGAPGELDTYLTAVDEAMSGYIQGVHSAVEPATNEFKGFTIRR